MRIVWLRRALLNLDGAAAWIARDDPRAAAHVATAIELAVERLSQFPESGRPGRVVGTRELVIADLPYIVPYRIRDGRIEILRVLHAARRWPARLS